MAKIQNNKYLLNTVYLLSTITAVLVAYIGTINGLYYLGIISALLACISLYLLIRPFTVAVPSERRNKLHHLSINGNSKEIQFIPNPTYTEFTVCLVTKKYDYTKEKEFSVLSEGKTYEWGLKEVGAIRQEDKANRHVISFKEFPLNHNQVLDSYQRFISERDQSIFNSEYIYDTLRIVDGNSVRKQLKQYFKVSIKNWVTYHLFKINGTLRLSPTLSPKQKGVFFLPCTLWHTENYNLSASKVSSFLDSGLTASYYCVDGYTMRLIALVAFIFVISKYVKEIINQQQIYNQSINRDKYNSLISEAIKADGIGNEIEADKLYKRAKIFEC